MKTKNKMFTIVEIAIMLCSVFLVALPAMGIAAEQSQEMQGVSATASEDDFVLGIYGNANEDDTIDMRDVTYTKLVIFGKKDETELADAYYDGEVDVLDVVQIKLIILGRESELTIVQYLRPWTNPVLTEEPVTVPMPIESIVAVGNYNALTVCAFGEADKIVGVGAGVMEIGEIRDLIEDKTVVGTSTVWDMEMILELNPDIVLALTFYDFSDYRETLDAVGISLVQMDFYVPEKYSKELSNLGWMLNKQERAEELISFEQQHLGLIEERVKDRDEEQKPRVYYTGYPSYFGEPIYTCGKGDCGSEHAVIEFCGGINIFADLEGYVTVDPEEVIVRNPQVIYAIDLSTACPLGYDITDTGPVEEYRQDMIMDYPGWDTIDAVKDGRVYFISTDAKSLHPSVYQSYVAKYFHPDLFEDVDPVTIHREWMERFLGIEYQGVYAYPTYPV